VVAHSLSRWIGGPVVFRLNSAPFADRLADPWLGRERESGRTNDEEDGADDDDDDSGYWERLTAYTDVLAAQALAPQRPTPTPGAYRQFFQTGLRDFEGSSDYLAVVGPAAFLHPTPRKRKSIEDENDENDNVERLEVMAIHFPVH
jgi:hypothetical protein